MPIIEQKLSKLFGGTAFFQMELKKILRENKFLKSEVGDLERQLADNSKSVLEELQKKTANAGTGGEGATARQYPSGNC